MVLGRKKIALQGGGGDTEAHFPTPPPSLLGRRDGRGGGFRAGVPDLPCRGGGVNPTSMAQNDTHVAQIILTTQMWGGGGDLWWNKPFRAKFLCSCAFGTNIRSYTKQRARHGTPFLQPPPLLRRASMSPPHRRAIFRLPCCKVKHNFTAFIRLAAYVSTRCFRWSALQSHRTPDTRHRF